MSITHIIKQAVVQSLENLYQQPFTDKDFQINVTKPEFEGDYTVVLFSLVKQLKKSPEQLGGALGEYMVTHHQPYFQSYNIIKGFLNFTISNQYWVNVLTGHFADVKFGLKAASGKKVMVEYSSPNTNKPLHLGHLRNNFLGWSVAEILKANGHEVIKSCVVNDRGIHICKSMIAWKLFANQATPASTQTKGDHFVGDYYVRFNEEYKKQVELLVENGMDKATAEKEAPIMKATQQMLVDWEAGNEEVLDLWKTMNGWVYEGFDATYQRIGSDFDKVYYESETYLPGKAYVEAGVKSGVFYQQPDGSIWVDLTPEGLDEKLLLRKDGTSVYMTQDLGLAQQKANDFGPDESIYVIGDEQNYHMKVLKLIAEKINIPHAAGIHHLSYGMVELPTGKMKSREGTVVDADDLVNEMYAIAASHTEALGKVKDFSETALTQLYHTISLGALKFYLLRVDPKKKMVFNPEESIDFHGYTGPFVQYTHARIKSVLRKELPDENFTITDTALLPLEKWMMVNMEQFPSVIEQAGLEYDPSVIASYAFHLAKQFNSFYTEHSITNAETPAKKQLRLRMALMTANILKTAMHLLGAAVPEQM